MKAAVFYGKGNIKIEERPIPKAGYGQAVIKMDYTGVCGTDIEAYKHEIIKPVIVLGHENVGTVYEIGEGVNNLKVGDKVLCGPPSYCKEACFACKSGKPNICVHGFGRTAGIGGPDGGYAEYMLVQDVEHTMIIKIPYNVKPEEAVLFDVICVALHALRKSNFKFGDNVVISGTGPIGISLIQIAKAAGARKVIAIGTNPKKFDLLKSYGADECIDAKTCENLAGEVRRLLGNEDGADVTFECAGNQNSVLNCIYHVAKNGSQVVLVGCPGEPMDKLILAMVAPREIDLITSFVYTPEEIQMYLSMVADEKIKFPNMVTDIITLDDLVEKGIGRKNWEGQLKILVKH